MYPEYPLVQKCLSQIEESLGWGPSEHWHNDVFSELSEKIQHKTQVLLSPTTLKRVWGKVNYKSAPSITTLNTLAQFAGFENWRDFKNETKDTEKTSVLNRVNSNLGIIMLAASVMAVVFISFYSLKGSQPDTELNTSSVYFNSRPLAKGLPNSVVFDLDIDSIQSDSIYIQQFWDPTKTITLEMGQKQATGQYYYPGYFRAKLVVDGKAIKQHDLFIKSEGWLGTVDYEPIPKYVDGTDILQGKLAFPPSLLEEIKTSDEPISSTFHIVDDFGTVSGDNFRLTTRLKSSYREKWAVCQKTQLIILGSKSSMVISTSIPGCVSEIGVMMSDVYLSGKKHDLSSLGVDLSEFRNLTLEVQEKQLTVFLEEQPVFFGNYNESMGDIAGMRFQFLGAGEVAKVHLQDLVTDKVIIDEDFNQ